MAYGKDPGVKRTIIINGEEYDATPEALQALDAKGVKYSAPEKGFWAGIQETLGDTARGAVHGASFGMADAKFGDDNQSLMQRLGGDDYKDVEARSPIASTIGDVSGSVLSPLSKIGTAAKGAHWLVKGGRAALGTGVEGLVREASESRDPEAAADAAATGAMLGGGTSALASLGGAALKSNAAGKLITGLGNAVKSGADTAVNKSFGIGARETKALAKRNGGKFDAGETAQHLENLVPLNSGANTADLKADALEAIETKMGSEIGSSLDEAGRVEGLDAFIKPSSGSPGTWAQIQQRLGAEANQLKQAAPGEHMKRNAAMGFSERLNQEAAPNTLGGLHQRVSAWGKEAYPTKGSMSSKSDTAAGEAAELGRSIGRDELGQLIDKYATEETAARFRGSMKGFADVADFASAARDRANVEAANSNLAGGAAAVAAPIVGGLTGLVTGGLPGAAIGAASGLGAAATSGTRNYLTQVMSGSRGYHDLARGGRYLQNKLGVAPGGMGPNAGPMKLQGMGESLAAQGNRQGLLGVEGMLAGNAAAPRPFEDEDEDY